MDDAINTAADKSQQVQGNQKGESAEGVSQPGPMINDTAPGSLPDDGPKDINNQNPY